MSEELLRFNEVMNGLESGTLRVARKENGTWKVDAQIKEIILSGFRLGRIVDMSNGLFSFFDKDTFPPRSFSMDDGVRIVPGGSMVRRGAYLAPSVVMMPPSYVNVGAYVDEGSMIDSNVIVGSCAQIGKHVHLAANCQIGGVLEPAGALPVIIGDNVFIGGGSGVYEGTIVNDGAVIGAGVSITRSTPVFDVVNAHYITPNESGQLEIPSNAVVVAGSRPIRRKGAEEEGIHVYLPVIVKYRDDKTSAAVSLEEALR